MSDLRQGLEVRNIQLGIADGLGVEAPGLFGDGLAELLRAGLIPRTSPFFLALGRCSDLFSDGMLPTSLGNT
jgi:hypothetical protein